MNEYVLVYGDRLVKSPTILFINDKENIVVYSTSEQARRVWQGYVDKRPEITAEALAGRFTYANTDFGPVDEKKKLELEKMIRSMSSTNKSKEPPK
jgi:hypothetical protein